MIGETSRSSSAFRIITIAVATLVVLAIGTGIWAINIPTKPKPVHIGSFSVAIDYAPYLIARHQGWLQSQLSAAGYNVEFTEFETLPSINEALATRNADVIFEAEPPAIIARSNGLAVSIKGISCSLIQQIIVPTSSGRNSVRDLKGAKIAVLAGTSSHYGLIRDLDEVGISSKDVSIIDMTPPNAKAAFETSQIDAWAVWPPFVEQETVAGTGRVLQGGDARINSIYVVRNAFAIEEPAAMRAISSAIDKTKSWILSHPAEAQIVVADELKLPLRVVRAAWPKHNFAETLSSDVIADIQSKAHFLMDQHFVRHDVDVAHDLIAK